MGIIPLDTLFEIEYTSFNLINNNMENGLLQIRLVSQNHPIASAQRMANFGFRGRSLCKGFYKT